MTGHPLASATAYWEKSEVARRIALAREPQPAEARAPAGRLLAGELGYLIDPIRRAFEQWEVAPAANRRTVLLLPGFGAHPFRMGVLARRLASAGHRVEHWGQGINLGLAKDTLDRIGMRLDAVHAHAGGPLHLVGWSLGGVFARELAKQAPEKVRLVISLGSPISDDRRYTNARKLFEYLNGAQPEPMRSGKFQKLAKAPPVPTTSILTKTDGVVHWRGSVQHGADVPGAKVENIEVHASHCGLGVNPAAVYAIADRLAQAEGEWKPFEAKGLASLFFPVSKLH